MIGRLSSESREVTIIGAGIAGLLAAYYLDQAGYSVTLIEAKPRAGGLLGSEQSELGLIEAAAHSIPATPEVKKLFEELGLKLLPMNDEAKPRYILRNGRLRRFPLSFFQAIGLFLRAYFKWAPPEDPEKLTLAQWATHFLGKPALTYLITPMTRGIFGAEPHEILVSAAFPALCVPSGHSLLSFFLAKKMRKHPPQALTRTVPKIPRGPISAPEKGMGSWVGTLTQTLEVKLGERFIKGEEIQSLAEFNSHDNLILAVTADEAAQLLQNVAPELSRALTGVFYSPLVTATIFAKKSCFIDQPRGLGVLIPAVEKRKALGILFNSSSFQNRVTSDDLVSLTMMLGGSSDPSVLELNDVALKSLITQELREILAFQGEPLEIHTRKWPHAVPQYGPALVDSWKIAQTSWCAQRGRILFGNYTGQVSLRGMVELASRLAK